MSPWRVYRLATVGTASWVSTSEVIYANSVEYTSKLASVGGQFVIDGGGNLSCQLSPDICGRTVEAKSIFYSTLKRHFFGWVTAKFHLLPSYLFHPYKLHALSGASQRYHVPTVIFRGALLITFCSLVVRACIMLVKSRLAGESLAWIESTVLFFAASIVLASLPVVILAHLEIRYFFFPWLFLISCCLLLLPNTRETLPYKVSLRDKSELTTHSPPRP